MHRQAIDESTSSWNPWQADFHISERKETEMEESICKHFQTGFFLILVLIVFNIMSKKTCKIMTCVQSVCKNIHIKACNFFTTKQKCTLTITVLISMSSPKKKSDISVLINEVISPKETINTISDKISVLGVWNSAVEHQFNFKVQC